MRYSEQQVAFDDIAAVVEVLGSSWLTQGPAIEAFEAALCEYTGAKYAVAVSSGTAALHLAYLAAGLKDMQTSPLSFVATANAALLAGYRVSFFDVTAATGNWDTEWAHGPMLVVPVHYAGRAARMPQCEAGGLVIEDAAHALGAMDFDGCSRVGSCAHSLATCFSMHPVKPITCGEGGAVTTNDQGFADEVRLLRSHGRDAQGRMVKLGLNYRMDEMSAALGLSQLKRCDAMRERRGHFASMYFDRLAALEGTRDGLLALPRGPYREEHGRFKWFCAWHLYPVRIKHGRRDEVKAELNAAGIGAQVHYSPIIPLQPYYVERYGYKPGQFPEAEAWAAEELSLPLHAGMTETDVQRVVAVLREALA